LLRRAAERGAIEMNQIKTKSVYFYSLYERLWHWMQASAVIALLVTGFMITFPRVFTAPAFKGSVYLHNVIGIVLAANAFLALFYNIAGGLLRRYMPGMDDFFSMGFKHAKYYLVGIFRGDPHPFEKTPAKRLLPLQKITYFMILNVLLPLMVITGLLKWSAMYAPGLVEKFGGLHVLAPVHRFGAWLFLSFVIMHIYMTTTGHTPLSSIVSMITGYEEVEVHAEGGQGHAES